MQREVSPYLVWPFFFLQMFLYRQDDRNQNRHMVQLESFFSSFFFLPKFNLFQALTLNISYTSLKVIFDSYLTDANPKTFFQKVITSFFSKYEIENLF